MIKLREKLNPLYKSGPMRLPEETLELAWRYLSGEFRETIKPADFALSDADRAGLTDNMIYAETVKLISEKAPLQLISGEKLAGSATLKEATDHKTPACDYQSTSHVTIGFDRVLHSGVNALKKRVQKRLDDSALTDKQRDFLNSMLLCLDAMEIWHKRYLDELGNLAEATTGEERENWLRVIKNLQSVPAEKPSGFCDAVQSLWFLFSFQRLCGNWSGLGRVDEMLWPYLESDLKKGMITLDEARDQLAHFWIKGTEWSNTGRGAGSSGDAQFYQNVVVGGRDVSGNDITNPVTYLILDIVEELHISDFPVAVRLHPGTPPELFKRTAEVMSLGGGIVSIYNEPVVIEAMCGFGYSQKEALSFTNDGCWEIIIPGKTAFTYLSFDILQILQESLISAALEPEEYQSFDYFYGDFLLRLKEFCRIQDDAAGKRFSGGIPPTPLLSLFVDDCIDRAASYNNRGAKYSVAAIHAGGIPDVVNSLHVIRELVYEHKKISLIDLVEILNADWKGHEALRQEIVSEFDLYGNDNPEVDAMFLKVFNDYTRIAGASYKVNGIFRPVGISTFGRELGYACDRQATVFGKFAGEYLAANLVPTPGTDHNGPTAVIKSFCKADFRKTPNGCPLDLKLHTSDSGNVEVILSLLKTFLDLGGFYLQLDVIDNNMLRDAQKCPDKYPNLVVRISGWSARFNTLDRNWQDLVINRTEQYGM